MTFFSFFFVRLFCDEFLSFGNGIFGVTIRDFRTFRLK